MLGILVFFAKILGFLELPCIFAKNLEFLDYIDCLAKILPRITINHDFFWIDQQSELSADTL